MTGASAPAFILHAHFLLPKWVNGFTIINTLHLFTFGVERNIVLLAIYLGRLVNFCLIAVDFRVLSLRLFTKLKGFNMKKIILMALLSVFASSANAGIFDSQSLQFQYLFPDQSTPYAGASNGTFAVVAGVEISNIVDNRGSLDLQSDGFTANFTDTFPFTSSTFNGFRITDIKMCIRDRFQA